MIYLDYAASTPVRPGALEVLHKSMKEDFANPSSSHKLGVDLKRRVAGCRVRFLRLLGGDEQDRLIFTASATESNNTIIQGLGLKPADAVIVSLADHPSITVPALFLENNGIVIKEMPIQPDGTPDEEGLLNLLDKSVKLVLLSHVNNMSGALTDIGLLSRAIKTRCAKDGHSVHIHVDASQGFGKFPISLREWNIDSLATAAHKIGGPKGVSTLYARKDLRVTPLLQGGYQETGWRSSTLAAPLIFSYCRAVEDAAETMQSTLDHVSRLNILVRETIKKKINGVEFPFEAFTSPFILTFICRGIPSKTILQKMEQRDIFISASAACSSQKKGPDPVFTALKLPEADHPFVLRVSFSYRTTEEEVLTFCTALEELCREKE